MSIRVNQQVRQLEQLFDRLDLEPVVRTHLGVALRGAEAAEVEPGERADRMLEAVTPEERAMVLGLRHWNDPDAYVRALRAGEPS